MLVAYGIALHVLVDWLALLLRIRRSRVQISAGRPAILTDVFVIFLSPSKQLPGYLKLYHDHFLQRPF
jgi:hypothetical protein